MTTQIASVQTPPAKTPGSRSQNTSKQTPARHVTLGLTDELALRMYEDMMLARALDERWWVLNRAGKVHFVISCRGQEAAQVGAAHALEKGVDWVHPYYRDLALCIALGMTPREIMLDIMGKAESPSSGGRQMPGHWGYPKLRIVTGSSPVMTQAPQACGIALAARIRGEKNVVFTDFGEGATASGDFHEALNWASIYKLPVIFLCQNNQYAISVPQRKQMAISNVADRACCYGIAGEVVDGNDVLAVYAAVKEAAARGRRGEGPTLIEAKTYRLVPHSSDDDDRRYRGRDEVQEWLKRDPLDSYRRYVQEEGLLDETKDKAIRDRVAQQVNDATDYALNAADPRADTLLQNVFADA